MKQKLQNLKNWAKCLCHDMLVHSLGAVFVECYECILAFAHITFYKLHETLLPLPSEFRYAYSSCVFTVLEPLYF